MGSTSDQQPEAPAFPAGEPVAVSALDGAERDGLIGLIAEAPRLIREAVAALGPDRLDHRYRNWTARQIVGHVADSHLHSYVRYGWTLTESHPTIKAYDEGRWVTMPGAPQMDVDASLTLLDGLHAVWAGKLSAMSAADFQLEFRHPESGADVSLEAALQYYAWHGQHHAAQLRWMAEHR